MPLDDPTLDRLFREHADALAVTLARRFPEHVALADDAVSHAFVKLREQPVAPARPAAWLHTVASRRLLDLIREGRKFVGEGLGDGPDTPVAGPPTLSRTTTRSLNAQLVHEVLASLSPRDRELLEAMYQQDADQRTIADRFGLALGSVGRTMARARERFRARFDDALAAYRAGRS